MTTIIKNIKKDSKMKHTKKSEEEEKDKDQKKTKERYQNFTEEK